MDHKPSIPGWVKIAAALCLGVCLAMQADAEPIPLPELRAGNLPDLHDGSLLDWQRILGDPLLTETNFISYDIGKGDQIAPPDLATKIYLGWTASPSRIYIGIEILDDVRIDEFEGAPPVPPSRIWASDSVEMRIDGDRGGDPAGRRPLRDDIEIRTDGSRGGGRYNSFRENERVLNFRTAQRYLVKATLPTGAILFLPNEKAWALNLPYSNAGGIVRTEPPTRTVIEFVVTPFDSLDSA